MISLFLSPRFPAVNPRRPTFLPPPTNQPTPLWEIKTSFSCFHNLWQVSSFSLSPSQPFGASSSLLARASFYTFFLSFHFPRLWDLFFPVRLRICAAGSTPHAAVWCSDLIEGFASFAGTLIRGELKTLWILCDFVMLSTREQNPLICSC